MSGAARSPQRRKITARELAERLGSSVRTAQRLVAEPRTEFLARARQRRARAVELRLQGLKYVEIAAEMECAVGTVSTLLHEARRLGEWPAEQRDTA